MTNLTTAPKLDATADLERVLIDEDALAARIAELGTEITRDYADKRLVLVSILKGGVIFLADLMRKINVHHAIELVGSSSYKGSTHPQHGVRITKDVDQSLTGKDVLLVEDIYDTGETIYVVHQLLKMHKPSSLEICALVRKNKPRPRELHVKYVGFDIDDVFVVGYGLDYKERYRNLPCIGVLKTEIYRDTA